jgi:hypothetical protein
MWVNRVCITWSAMAIAFSFGCLVRHEVGGQLESMIHVAGISVHSIVITVYLVMAQRRVKENSQ